MGTPKTEPDYEHSEAALREADAFDAWMLTVNPKHQPTDDGMETRLLRKCWEAANERAMIALREWAVNCWRCEVQHRPMVNKHRRTLDDCWRQVMRYAGLDPDDAVGLSHDALLAAGSAEMARRDALGPWEDRA